MLRKSLTEKEASSKTTMKTRTMTKMTRYYLIFPIKVVLKEEYFFLMSKMTSWYLMFYLIFYLTSTGLA